MWRIQRILRLLDAAHRVDVDNRRRQLRHMRERNDPFDVPDAEFVATYRLPKETVLSLIEELTPFLNRPDPRDISVARKVLIALGFFAAGSYQRGVGQGATHGVCQPTVSRAIAEVTDALNHPQILTKYIVFPRTPEARNTVKRRFFEVYNFPGIVGCIDGTHVCILRPAQNEEEYFNRKHTHSLNVQIICDADLIILSVDASHGGATHDSAVWNGHPLKEYLQGLYDQGEAVWLLGDSGYAQRVIMMTPIVDATPGTREALYTDMHVKTRNCVERCIGVLKARWRCLLAARMLHYKPEKAARIVNACVVLHNVARKTGAPLLELTPEEEEEERREAIEGQAHAQGRDPPAQQPQQRRVDRALHAGREARASLVAQLRRR
ncbi:putative nuclease HARBI1 [Plutella xylostella]|uniref:putative nuclease HARBI1 n=1 Tax=Plutella xylostella TaxID=51655 RepID=UPI0020326368|nr:putative nuclease HARBI1 [Plutella xylostella]